MSQRISDYPSGASEVSRSITDCVTRVSDALDLILRLIVAIIAPRDERMASAVEPALLGFGGIASGGDVARSSRGAMTAT